MKSIHCTNCFLREKKNGIIDHGFLQDPFAFLAIAIPGGAQSHIETVISFGGVPSASRCWPWSHLHTPPSSPVLPLRVAHWLFSRNWSPPLRSGVPEPLSARTPPCQLQAPASAWPFHSGPRSRLGQPRGEEAESTFWTDFLSATGQSSQETREWATGDEGVFISSAGNSGFISPRPF